VVDTELVGKDLCDERLPDRLWAIDHDGGGHPLILYGDSRPLQTKRAGVCRGPTACHDAQIWLVPDERWLVTRPRCWVTVRTIAGMR
jgi:hypothetical protein